MATEVIQITKPSNELLVSAKNTFIEAYELMIKKNHDYAGDEDPMANFKKGKELGIDEVTYITLFLNTKISRINRLVKTGVNKVKGESLRDSLIDLINYAAIGIKALEDAEAKLNAPVE